MQSTSATLDMEAAQNRPCSVWMSDNPWGSFSLEKMHTHLFYGTETTEEYAFMFAWWNPEPWFAFAFDKYGIISEGESFKAKCTFTKLRFTFPPKSGISFLIKFHSWWRYIIDKMFTGTLGGEWRSVSEGPQCEFVRELFGKGTTWKLWGGSLGRWRFE